MSNRMTIKQAAIELGISTKTLRRWEKSGYLVPERQDVTGVRLYHPYLINYWKKLFDLRRAIINHLRSLDGIKKAIDKHTSDQNNTSGQPPKLLTVADLDDFMKASESEEKWNRTYHRMLRELREYPSVMRKATTKFEEDK